MTMELLRPYFQNDLNCIIDGSLNYSINFSSFKDIDEDSKITNMFFYLVLATVSGALLPQ